MYIIATHATYLSIYLRSSNGFPTALDIAKNLFMTFIESACRSGCFPQGDAISGSVARPNADLSDKNGTTSGYVNLVERRSSNNSAYYNLG